MAELKTQKSTIKTPHNIIMENKEKLSLSGIVDVGSFDEEKIVVFTEDEMLTVCGSDLHIIKLSLDTGELSIEGEINSLIYSSDENPKNGGSFFAKLFK